MPTLVNNLRAIRGPVTAVPMVGQSGVVVEPDTQNNQVVVRADETVLWTGSSTTTAISIPEPITNFERFRVYGYERERSTPLVQEFGTDYGSTARWVCLHKDVSAGVTFWTSINEQAEWNAAFTQLTLPSTGCSIVYAWSNNTWTKLTGTVWEPPFVITKIIGINRIANN